MLLVLLAFEPEVLPLVAPEVEPLPEEVAGIELDDDEVPGAVLPEVLAVPLLPIVEVLPVPGVGMVPVDAGGVDCTMAPPPAPSVPPVVAPWPLTLFWVDRLPLVPADAPALLLMVAVLLDVWA